MHSKDAAASLAGAQQQARNVARYAMQVQDFGRGPASWQHYAGPRGRTIHFAPANGMPAATYLFLLEELAQHGDVYSMDNRGAWPGIAAPEKRDSWRLHLDDFLAFARRQYREPIHYVGHSMGASVGLLAALRHPEMFASITMIDPGTVPNLALALMMRLAPERTKQNLPLIRSTRQRRASWPTREAFQEYIGTRSTYRNFTTRALLDYAYGGLQPCDDGVCLRFMPAWEAHNFKSSAHVWPLMHKLKVPAVLVRGQHSNVFPVARYREIGRRLERASKRGRDPALRLVEVPGVGHMLPQEGPQQALDVVLSHWAQL